MNNLQEKIQLLKNQNDSYKRAKYSLGFIIKSATNSCTNILWTHTKLSDLLKDM